MDCGCNAPGTGAPLLTGTLDPAFSSSMQPSADESLLGSQTSAAKPSTLFWEAVAVIAFVVVASWVVYKAEKKRE